MSPRRQLNYDTKNDIYHTKYGNAISAINANRYKWLRDVPRGQIYSTKVLMPIYGFPYRLPKRDSQIRAAGAYVDFDVSEKLKTISDSERLRGKIEMCRSRLDHLIAPNNKFN
ncbi:hypothetical protein TNCV_4927151 [Trichonephila clavipes]|nr:hypothetical protein TNCV_4927151 [Trichonephila clavipes]